MKLTECCFSGNRRADSAFSEGRMPAYGSCDILEGRQVQESTAPSAFDWALWTHDRQKRRQPLLAFQGGSAGAGLHRGSPESVYVHQQRMP